jgi:membrane protein
MSKLLKNTVASFFEDEALSRGAAIAFYTVTSLAPVLLIVIAIAGLVFGQEAAQKKPRSPVRPASHPVFWRP